GRFVSSLVRRYGDQVLRTFLDPRSVPDIGIDIDLVAQDVGGGRAVRHRHHAGGMLGGGPSHVLWGELVIVVLGHDRAAPSVWLSRGDHGTTCRRPPAPS